MQDKGDGSLPCKVFNVCISVLIYLRMTSVLLKNDWLPLHKPEAEHIKPQSSLDMVKGGTMEFLQPHLRNLLRIS